MKEHSEPSLSKAKAFLESHDKVFISITGLELKRPWYIFHFFRHAVPSMTQAQKADGNLFTSVLTIHGVRHTLTAWTSKRAMSKFLYAGAHGKAIAIFDKIATGKTYGYESDHVPSWEEARTIYDQHAKDYTKKK